MPAIPVEAVIIEPLTAAVGWILSISLFKKYLDRKKEQTLTLAIYLILGTIGVTISAYGRVMSFLAWQSNIDLSTHPTSVLGYVFFTVANIFLYKFVHDIFIKEKTFLKYYFAAISGIMIGALLYHLFTDPFYDTSKPTEELNWAYFALAYVIFTLLTFTLISIIVFRGARKITVKYYRRGLQLIGFYQLTVILAFLVLVIDIVASSMGVALIDDTNYSWFFILAWLILLISMFMAYIGYTMPNWFKKMFQDESRVPGD